MKISSSITILLLSLLLFGCSGGGSGDGGDDRGLSNNACPVLGLNTRIINGTACGEARSPIVRINVLNLQGVALCSGSLITPDTVLTAAHCFFGRVIDTVVDVNGEEAQVREVVVHPEVSIDPNTQAVFNDVAIIRLNRSLPGAPLPILGTRDVDNGDIISIFGYGLDENNNADTLRSGEMRVSGVSNNHIFAAFNGEGSNTCNGDSGGPAILTFTDDSGREVDVIVGIVSSGELISCSEGDTTLFTNVLEEPVFSFITNNVPGVGVN